MSFPFDAAYILISWKENLTLPFPDRKQHIFLHVMGPLLFNLNNVEDQDTQNICFYTLGVSPKFQNIK